MAKKAPKASLLQKLEGLLVIILTTSGSAKSAISTVTKRNPYVALLLFLMVVLTMPLLMAVTIIIVLFFTGAVSSTVVTISIVAPIILMAAWSSFLLWMFLVGGTYVYRRTLAGWTAWRQIVSRFVPKPKPAEEPAQAILEEFETQLASLKPPGTDGWPVLSFDPLLDNEPYFQPLEKDLGDSTILTSLKTPIIVSTPVAPADETISEADGDLSA